MSTVIKIETAVPKKHRSIPILELSGDFVLDLLLICGEYASGNLSSQEADVYLQSLDVMDQNERMELLKKLHRDNTLELVTK